VSIIFPQPMWLDHVGETLQEWGVNPSRTKMSYPQFNPLPLLHKTPPAVWARRLEAERASRPTLDAHIPAACVPLPPKHTSAGTVHAIGARSWCCSCAPTPSPWPSSWASSAAAVTMTEMMIHAVCARCVRLQLNLWPSFSWTPTQASICKGCRTPLARLSGKQSGPCLMAVS
jgi:hypothetical protein